MATIDADRVRAAQPEWTPEGVYLNTASYGLPPRRSWEAIQAAMDDWRVGRTSWEPWAQTTEQARAGFGRLVGVAPERVVTGAAVSNLLGLVAASLPDGTRVLAPDVDFPSTLFPFLVQAGRGVEVRHVPMARLAEAVDAGTDVVAFSAVQMATGEVADLGAIAAAERHHGALTVVDATQACGWLPLDAADFDVVAVAAYKWLMSPRGSAFMTLAPGRLEEIVPHTAGWCSGEEPYGEYRAPPLRLTPAARRLDLSPAWFSWVGTAPVLELIGSIGVPAIQAHDVALANAFRAGLGQAPGNSAIVVTGSSADLPRLRAAGVMASEVAGAVRTSWHVHNTEEDVEAALAAIGR